MKNHMMKIRILSYLFIVILIGCQRKEKLGHIAEIKEKVTFKIEKDDFIKWPEANVKQVAYLETTPTNVFSDIDKLIMVKNKFFILDRMGHRILVFSENGDFIYSIDKQGKGPGEYRELRNFCISADKKILYTLDYKKVHAFNLENGVFLNSFEFNVPAGSGHNPSNFLNVAEDVFYFWSGSPDVSNPGDKVYYSLFRYEKQTQKIEELFPTQNYLFSTFNRFTEGVGESYLMTPPTGDFSLYRVTKDGIKSEMEINFGEKQYHAEMFPKNLEKFNSQEYDRSKYFKSPSLYYETEDYLYIKTNGPEAFFWDIFYHKKSGKYDVGKATIASTPKIIYANEKEFVGMVQPYTLKMNGINRESEFYKGINIDQLDEQSNPILFRFTLK